ncbi:MAG: hypothetical protein ACJ0SL_00280 [Candidatus Rariloculaceae bacterium]
MTDSSSLRIVSLLPSATEIVCELGLGENLVGVSHECDFPVGVEKLPVVTSSVIPKNAPSGEIDTLVRDHLKSNSALDSLDLELLEKLRPTLIVTQALCDVCAVSAEDVEAAVCVIPGRPTVVNLEPMSVEDLFTTMTEIGRKDGVVEKTNERVAQLRERIATVAERSA